MEMKRKKIIRTSNREIYEKFNNLHFSSSVILENATNKQLGKILKNINSGGEVLKVKKLDNYFIIKKVSPINFSIYLK